MGQLGLVSFLSFGLMFAAGWGLDRWLGTGFFTWIGVLFGIAALYYNAAKLLKHYLRSGDDGPDESD